MTGWQADLDDVQVTAYTTQAQQRIQELAQLKAMQDQYVEMVVRAWCCGECLLVCLVMA